MNFTEDILVFWFKTLDLKNPVEKRDVWFRSTPKFDREIRYHFLHAHETALAGDFDNLKDKPSGCLALTILLDQFSRNIFRHSAKAYAADSKARNFAHYAIEKKYDKDISQWHRAFFYLPFEHSENLKDQNLSVDLFSALGIESALEAAKEHRQVIMRFGRFPHRNEALGRKNTPAEEFYLKDPPPWGKTKTELEQIQLRKVKT